MTDDELYIFLYDWCNKILNTDLSLGITIIQAYEDAPPPDPSLGNYITIDPTPQRNKIGRFSSGDMQDPVGPPTDPGTRTLVNQYEGSIQLREVGGNDNLRILIDSISRQEIKDLWSASSVAYLRESNIQFIPILQGMKWRKESFVDIMIGIPEGTLETNQWIADVEYSGDIPAQGRSGNHTLTNT